MKHGHILIRFCFFFAADGHRRTQTAVRLCPSAAKNQNWISIYQTLSEISDDVISFGVSHLISATAQTDNLPTLKIPLYFSLLFSAFLCGLCEK
jgi:hypothetical protein